MRTFILIAFLLTTLSSYTQESDCANFKTGTYIYANSKYAEWKITRTNNLQIEKSSKTGIEIYSSVTWTSDCEYVLTCEKVLNSESKDYVGKVFQVKITETLLDRYTCILKTDLGDVQLEMIKTD